MNPLKYLWNLLFSTFPTQTPLPVKHTRKKRTIVSTTLSCRKWDLAHDKLLMSAWEDGAPIEWLANYFNRSTSAIKTRLIAHGYSTRKNAPRTRALGA